MQSKLIKDNNLKYIYIKNFIKKKALDSLIHACKYNFNNIIIGNTYYKLYNLSKANYKNYNKNRCLITGRSRYILYKYGISRSIFKKYVFENKLPGLKRSSW